MEKLIAKLIKILDGEEGPEWQGDYVEDALYTYPERIDLARKVAVEVEKLLIDQPDKPCDITGCKIYSLHPCRGCGHYNPSSS